MSSRTQAPAIVGVEGSMRFGGRGLAFVALGAFVGSLGFGAAGCASRPRTEALPRIVIQPGAAERIALMDRYRLNDDLRKREMVRPHTWVEEVSEDELLEGDARPEAAASRVSNPPDVPAELRERETPTHEPQADATALDR